MDKRTFAIFAAVFALLAACTGADAPAENAPGFPTAHLNGRMGFYSGISAGH